MKKPNKKFIPYAVVICILIIVLSLVILRTVQQNNRKTAIAKVIIPAKVEVDSSNNSDALASGNNTDKNSPSTPASQTAGTTTNDAVLIDAPSGTFVSNHYPSLSGAPSPSQEESTCNTIPGSGCYIQFTKSDGTIKKLEAKTAGDNGVIVWTWDINTAGFTEGEWTITAVSSLNGTTKSTTDSIKLVVKP